MSTDGDKMENLKIISVSTGTKCINGEHMSVHGNSLNGKISSGFNNILQHHSNVVPAYNNV